MDTVSLFAVMSAECIAFLINIDISVFINDQWVGSPEKCNGNFPEKYEIFRTNFPPHTTSLVVLVLDCRL